MVYDKELNLMLEVIDNNTEYYLRNIVIEYFNSTKLNILETFAQSILADIEKNKDTDIVNQYFATLEKLLLILEKIAFVFNIKLTQYLNHLVSKVYRLDTPVGKERCIECIDELLNAQLDFNNLELEILEFMLSTDSQNSKILKKQLQNSCVADRYYTGHGFFTGIHVDRDKCEPVAGVVILPSPNINTQSMEYGGGFVLFLRDGYLDFLEGYSYTDEWPIDVGEFTITSEPWGMSQCPNRKTE